LLKHFQVPDDIAVRVKIENLTAATKGVFLKMGVPEADADLATDVLMKADLRGADTHGVSNMLRAYVASYGDGRTNPTPNEKIVRETASTAVYDGDNGLGIITTPHAMDIAIAKAKNTGVGMVTIKNSGHAGMMAYHALMAVKEGMIGTAYTAGGNSMVPTWGAEPKLGTNPIAFAAPAGTEEPFSFDAATTSIAGNKIGLANRLGHGLQPGWVANDDGSPDMEGAAISDFSAGGVRMQLPMGSTRELGSHKGYSLGVMVDIMCGPLSGAAGFGAATKERRAHFVAAYDVEAFVPLDEFKADMDGMMKGLRETKPAPGHDRVVYAGMIEVETEAERREIGIPLHPEVVDWFEGITSELNIPFNLRD
jgi:LDH2 family malate/lactate/ureidoglycolate dehydrogenase|tara:strand:+ start:477 stop:1574 length:1098 start_codon:yes stop_codon:yes gene_type:complete